MLSCPLLNSNLSSDTTTTVTGTVKDRQPEVDNNLEAVRRAETSLYCL